ncbi:MAG: hypothetical protein ACYTDT_01375 [Planctomycetota bacterium]|jgi:hypothetical protein
MFRFLFIAVMAAALCQFALATYAQPSGYDHGIVSLPLSGTGSLVWDVAGGQAPGECYLWNDGDFRRITPSTSTVSASGLFGGIPTGQNSFDYAAIDPLNPNVVYASFSTWTPAASSIYVFTRTGPDAATSGTSQSYSAYTAINTTATAAEEIAIYRLRFMPNLPSVPASLRGALIAIGGDTAFGLGMGPTKIWAVNTNSSSGDYLKLTELATIANPSASGNATIDADGNVYSVLGYTLPNDRVLMYSAADLALALAGSVSPLTQANATDVVAASHGLGDISSIAVREEEGVKYLYYGESNTGSIFRRNLTTNQSRLWAQGFGPIDGWNYWGGTSCLEFESLTDDFKPFGGGTSQLVTTFSIGATNTAPFQYGTITSQFHKFLPYAANGAVATLNALQAPTSIGNGIPFTVSLEALNGSGGTILSDVAIEVSLTTGGGTLSGFLTQLGPGSQIDLTELQYTHALTTNEAISLSFTVAGTATTLALPVTALATGSSSNPPSSDDDDRSGGCASSTESRWPLAGLLALFSLVFVARRKRKLA